MTSTSPRTDLLATRIYSLVQGYVHRRTEEKSGIAYDSFKDKKVTDPTSGKERIDYPPKYVEMRKKVCKDAFLRLRSCRSREDFLAYFTGSICSVPQFLPKDDFVQLTAVFLDGNAWEDARDIAMLALSAHASV
jgi:CRISPR-associated protein Cmx8